MVTKKLRKLLEMLPYLGSHILHIPMPKMALPLWSGHFLSIGKLNGILISQCIRVDTYKSTRQNLWTWSSICLFVYHDIGPQTCRPKPMTAAFWSLQLLYSQNCWLIKFLNPMVTYLLYLYAAKVHTVMGIFQISIITLSSPRGLSVQKLQGDQVNGISSVQHSDSIKASVSALGFHNRNLFEHYVGLTLSHDGLYY